MLHFRQFLPLYFRESWRRVSRQVAVGRASPWRFWGSSPDRLVVAPTDLRIADPYIAHEIHQGRYPLAGRVLETDNDSPFLYTGPSLGFDEMLHSFRWLRHLRAANTEESFADARTLTEDWINLWGRRYSGIGWDANVTAQRVIAWLSHSPIILKKQDRGFYRRFIRSLALQIRYLRKIAPAMRDGEKRFRVRIALAMATLALPATPAAIRHAARFLDQEIDKQILPDGGHISRNPQVAMTLLADLLPLRQTYLNLGHTPPKGLVSSIDRMFQALRFFRHVDGTLALFNGCTAQPADRLLSVLRYDESTGEPPRSTPQMNYQRLSNHNTVIIADTGPYPAGELSATAHAGCLSFELSSGHHRFIVNAGSPAFYHAEYRRLARATAAHSTLIIDDTSSATISGSSFLGPIMTNGPQKVDLERRDEADGRQGFIARHDGYAELFGLIHERSIQLSADGNMVTGRDRIAKSASHKLLIDGETPGVIRFHIHPKIAISRDNNNDIVLTAPDSEIWTFFSPDAAAEIEDDIFFADLAGPRRSQQICLHFIIAQQSEVSWSMVRTVPKAKKG
ncbi:heparinase II/III family protein [Nitratireductor sp. XY-223]|uniref:heparinase II/III family protein n=1 Tax=Nitratireductor sp. XY-223 TaxID=2561926 RepID=UPI0010AABD29|nr:heparinase II/III family protein [Nitratireductor sp. XY-223]